MPKKSPVRVVLDDEQLERLATQISERLPRHLIAKIRGLIKATTMTADRSKWIDNAIHPERAYTTEQLCGVMGVHRVTLARWRRDGLRHGTNGIRTIYLGSDVIEFFFTERAKPKA